MSKKNGAGKFLLGAAIGAGLGILFAPAKGSDTRKQLKRKIDKLVEQVKDIDMDEVKEEIENKIEEIKEELEDLDKEKALKIAKEKGKAIQKKAEELVDLAVKKGTPVVEQAAVAVKEKTILVVKDILKKLEKEDK